MIKSENKNKKPAKHNITKKDTLSNSSAILEAFKLSDINRLKNNNLNRNWNYDSLIKFRQFY